MITYIIVALTTLLTISINLIYNPNNLSVVYIVYSFMLGIITFLVINGVCATIFCKCLPEKWFASDKRFFNVWKWEQKFYNFLKIKKWKDHTLELGMLNGFRKNKLLNPNDNNYIEKFIIESNRGIMGHFIGMLMASCLLFLFPNNIKLSIGLPITIANILINMMSVFILRYNIPKLKILLKRNKRKQAT